MSRISNLMLRFENWPAEDQSRWEAAFKTGDRFDESGRGAHLEKSTERCGKRATQDTWDSYGPINEIFLL